MELIAGLIPLDLYVKEVASERVSAYIQTAPKLKKAQDVEYTPDH